MQNQADVKELRERQTIIVFSPHPDDEIFGCGGTIAKSINEGSEVFVVIMTDGRHAKSQILPEELIRVRKEEAKRALGILGLKEEKLIFLDFEDKNLDRCSEEAEKMVTDLLIKYSPTIVYYPYERDFHVDHKATNSIVKNALKKARLNPALYEYSISSKKYVSAKLSRILNPIFQKTVNVDISNFLPLKIKAIEEHKSQIESDSHAGIVVKNPKRFMSNIETFFIQ
jgi:N-acetylglucosamine malate deacetylase 1